ncbi:hypothetical protein [Prosthecobacter sp.]|uniref:hypothetical protein n=1 Tax=Prosthecobacter sp. TaxID=1965333 RepID=UPI0037846B2E
MNLKLMMQRLFPALLALLLSSCLDYEEEMWLEDDLSGKVTMTVMVSDTLANFAEAGSDQLSIEKVRQMIAGTEGLEVEETKSFRENGKQVSQVTIRFEDVRRLTWLATSSKEPAWVIGTIDVEKKDGRMKLRRTLGPFTTEATSGSRQQNALARGFSGLLLGSYSLTYTLHLPHEPLNADSMQVSRKSNTVRWRFPLGQLATSTGTMSTEWEAGGGGSAWVWALMILSGGGAFGWWKWQRRQSL